MSVQFSIEERYPTMGNAPSFSTRIDASPDVAAVKDAAVKAFLADAVAREGERALESPRRATIFHEAAHCVVFKAAGMTASGVKVWRAKRGPARGNWNGWTGSPEWRIDEGTTAEHDFQIACCLLAGVVGEQLFDSADFRAGSSADEIVWANNIAGSIAFKTGRNPEEVMNEVIGCTKNVLRQHAHVVHAIADQLSRNEIVGRSRLARMLAEVKWPPAEEVAA